MSGINLKTQNPTHPYTGGHLMSKLADLLPADPTDLFTLLTAPDGDDAISELVNVQPDHLTPADLARGRASLLRAMADTSDKIDTSAYGLYRNVVKQMATIAAHSRTLQRAYRMTRVEICDALNALGRLHVGLDMTFSMATGAVDTEGLPVNRVYTLKSFSLTGKSRGANLKALESAFAPLIRPMEVTENGRVVIDAPVDDLLIDSVTTALIKSGVNLTLDPNDISGRVLHAFTSKALAPQEADNAARKLAQTTRTVSTGKVVKKDMDKDSSTYGRYKLADATPEQIQKAKDRLPTDVAKLADVITLSDDKMATRAKDAKDDRLTKSAESKRNRELGAWALPILESFGITNADHLTAALTAAQNAGYEYVAPAEPAAEAASLN